MRFGVFFGGFHHWSSDLGDSPYAVLLDVARFADRNALAFVSTPERHFSRAGGLFPNPALAGAAVAAVTTSVQIRAGSVIAPIHDPVRLVEDWSVVDVLSGGRVGLSFAPGGDANDYALAPDSYANRQALVFRQVAEVCQLWRTRSVRRGNGAGTPVDLTVYPEAVSADLPVWIAVSRDRQASVEAGRIGANLLVSSQDPEDLADHVAHYRQARAAAGFDGAGVVTVLACTFVSDETTDLDAAAAALACHSDLPGQPDHPAGVSTPPDGRAAAVALRGHGRVAVHYGRKHVDEHCLVGTVAACQKRVRQLERAGADEIACVVDFVADLDLLRRGLPGLAALQRICGSGGAEAGRAPLHQFMGWG